MKLLGVCIILAACSTISLGDPDHNETIQCVIGEYLWCDEAVICHVECASNCTCTLDDANTVISNCTDGSVSTSQVLYPAGNVTCLDWNGTLHAVVKPKAFERFGSTLETLLLGNVGLDEIHPGAFSGLSSLLGLALHSNALDEIQPGVFAGLSSLQYLFLYNNALDEIQPGVFAGLSSLQYLSLYNNTLDEIQPGVFAGLSSLQRLFLDNNALDEIHPGLFTGLSTLEILYLSYNKIHEIQPVAFSELKGLHGLSLNNNMIQEIPPEALVHLIQLQKLILANNFIHDIAPNTFKSLRNLTYLNLENNKLSVLYSTTFQNQTSLVDLLLGQNHLVHLPPDIFDSLTNLQTLNISSNNLNQIPILSKCTALSTIIIKRNPLMWITREVFVGLNSTTQLLVTSPTICCYAVSLPCINEDTPSPFLTCTRLLTLDFLRIVTWFAGIFGIFGNLFAIYSRFRDRLQSNKVQFLLITNLSISDLTMCIYLIVLLSVDAYVDFFPANSELWRKSPLCRFAGALSVLSSEVSAFLITLISIDRFLAIKYPFSGRRLGTRTARLAVLMIWLVALCFSTAAFILSGKDSNYYRISEVCIGLPISRLKTYNSTQSRDGYLHPYSLYEVHLDPYPNTSMMLAKYQCTYPLLCLLVSILSAS